MEKVGEIEVVDVRDNVESGVTCRREEESLMDENVEIFYTILVVLEYIKPTHNLG